MFTGLIETTGMIKTLRSNGQGVALGIAPANNAFKTSVGASIAVDGVCLTVESITGGIVFFTAVAETVVRTTLTKKLVGSLVNLERAVAADGRFEGHMVLGHVDGIGVIAEDRNFGESLQRTIEIPAALMPLCAEKGSITIDGISLTIAVLTSTGITIAFIPHTLAHTTMGHKKNGDSVNIEGDVIARYLVRLLETRGQHGQKESSLMDKLERYGF